MVGLKPDSFWGNRIHYLKLVVIHLMNPSTWKIGLIAFGVATFFTGLLAYSYFIEPFCLVVNEKEIVIDGWEKEFDGFRAVLISDIHGGSHGVDAEQIQRMVETANAQDPDAIFILGDSIATTHIKTIIMMPVPETAYLLSGLRAKHGVFAVMGNHEGAYDPKFVTREFEKAGINVLDGEVAFIEKNGKRLRILGLRDHLEMTTWADTANDAKGLLAPSEGTGSVIVLEHSPDVLQAITGELLISNELKIMFAGHTHGGQVWLPIFGYPIVPSSYGQKYAAGHVKDAGLDMFVTTGIGTTTLPFRFMVPPEIALITIRSK